MHDADWSEELKDLRAGSRHERDRSRTLHCTVWVLTALRREVRATERESFWNFVVGLAAVFLLAQPGDVIRPWAGVNVTDDPEGVATAAQRLHALVPEITAEAAYAEVLMASSWSRLPKVPNMGAEPSIVAP